jgi:hypothetical protein
LFSGSAGVTETPQRLEMRRHGELSALVVRPAWPARRLLTFLHGRGEAAADEAGQPTGAPLDELVRRHGPQAVVLGGPRAAPAPVEAVLAETLILCPQLPRRRQWREADADAVVAMEDALMAGEAQDLPRHLTGFSWGGAGVTRFAGRRDLGRRWRTLWIVDPSPDPSVTPLPPEPSPALLHWGRYFDQALMAAWRERGGFDGTLRPGARRAERDTGESHVETAREAYRDVEAWGWLTGFEDAPATV